METNGRQMAISIVLVFFLVILMQIPSNDSSMLDKDHVSAGNLKFLDAETHQIIKYMGYKNEIHDVFSDGYVIRLNRMINPLASEGQVKRTVLFLHGLLQNSISNWLGFAEFVKPKKPEDDCFSPEIYANLTQPLLKDKLTNETLSRLCYPCMFSDNNYDVWIIDERGTSEGSRQYTDANLATGENYWSHNMDDLTLLDLPNVINYVIHVTKRKKLTYVGVSKGTYHMFALLAARPHYADKLDAFVALDPFYYGYVKGSLLALLPLVPVFMKSNDPFLSVGMSRVIDMVFNKYCNGFAQRICIFLLNTIVGIDINNDNIVTDVNLSHMVSPTSSRQIAQLGQGILTKRTTRFDYGEHGNLQAYGQNKPPEYDLSKIKFNKIILARSEGADFLSTKEDQRKLIKDLGAPIFKDIVLPPYYNHFSIGIHKDAFQDAMAPVMRAVNEAYLK